ncbi:hypothetical protein HPB48_012082 [Haemaphysalis longicornis]|uniref:Uncharacterized protein n=1 Tax=Haemaphysalis longicornis TaxID=44386 RepID=A0A9J6FLS7_HAELO|nr:hypothetical protein HPB48_012082 [Haemaphysalis longicornis]
MDEVEGLCDRVAIMIDGELQCLGSLVHLQEKFAQGFTVTVKTHVEYKGDEEYRAKLLRAIRETFPDSKLQQSYEVSGPRVRVGRNLYLVHPHQTGEDKTRVWRMVSMRYGMLLRG